MKFRPLCVDYHARAQEILSTERDIRARRAALCVLPNPVMSLDGVASRRHRHSRRCDTKDVQGRDSLSNEDIGRQQGCFTVNHEGRQLEKIFSDDSSDDGSARTERLAGQWNREGNTMEYALEVYHCVICPL